MSRRGAWLLAALLAACGGSEPEGPDMSRLDGRWHMSGHAGASLGPQAMTCTLAGTLFASGTLDAYRLHGSIAVARRRPERTDTTGYTLTLFGNRTAVDSVQVLQEGPYRDDLAIRLSSASQTTLEGSWRCGALYQTVYSGEEMRQDSAVATGEWSTVALP